MMHSSLIHEGREDLAEDLARTLPKWVSWIPVVGKASYRRWVQGRSRRQPENLLNIEFLSSRIDLYARDEGLIQLEFLATNFGPRPLEIERVELMSLQVGSRSLRRRGEMFAMTYSVPTTSSIRTTLHVDLVGGDLRNVAQGVGKALNGWTSPQVTVAVYGAFHCFDRHRRFRKALQRSTDMVYCTMSETVVESLLNSDGIRT
jgi:hypothetical protein